MEEKIYTINLFENPKLIIKTNTIFYHMMVKKTEYVVKCNTSTNLAELFKISPKSKTPTNLNSIIIKGTVEQLNEDGSRWEGDWYNEKPFGFGSLYDGEGNRMYSGFMFDGKKIGFGTEYFADNHKVDYCGNFMNDKRHGWGESYDRNNIKLFEGDWRCGKNDFEDERIVIEDKEDCLRIHDLIKELVIGENCLNEWKDDLIIQNYSNLESIVVKKNSLRNLNSLKICNCEKLKSIEIEDGDWRNDAFSNVKNVIIESI